MKNPRQTQIFGALDSAELISIALPNAQLSKDQRTFNRLTQQLKSKRALLLEWQQYSDAFPTVLQESFIPLMAQLRAAQCALVHAVDALLTQPSKAVGLNQTRRKTLLRFVIHLVTQLLRGDKDEALIAVFDRHSPQSYAETMRAQIALTEVLMSEVYGLDVGPHQATDVDELMEHAEQQLNERARADAERREAKREARAQRPQHAPRVSAAAARKAQAEQETKQSVRDIFRQLASALHPDREHDPAERARKTELMQRINLAYKQNDLLTLLTLQIEIEQISSADFGQLAPERLKRYNQVLKEQLQTIDAELNDHRTRFEETLNAEPWLELNHPKDAKAQLQRQIKSASQHHAQMVYDAEALADPLRRNDVVDEIKRAYAADPEMFNDDFNFDDFDDEPPPRRVPRRAR